VTDPLAIAFPGQGGDWRAVVATLHEHAAHPLAIALAEALGTDRWEDLDGLDTRVAQPAVYVAGLVAAPAAGPGGEAITVALGHSLGEITAAAWAGAIDPMAGLALTVERGRLGDATQRRRPGAMAAINRWSEAQVDELRRELLERDEGELVVGVINSPTQLVLSGDLALIERAAAEANARGAVARRLPISGAYHSPLMAELLAGFRTEVERAVTAAPSVPVLSSTLQQAMTTPDALIDGLSRALVLPVDWPRTVAAAGVARAIDAGPGDTLTRLARFVPGLQMVQP
jgi:[acyl-carrier-protein] S-malonyltransferase